MKKGEVKTLKNGQQIRVKGFKYEPVIRVFAEQGETTTILEAGVLSSNYEGKAEELVKKHNDFIEAVEIEDGEKVKIKGKIYKTKVIGSMYSDPVHFIVK